MVELHQEARCCVSVLRLGSTLLKLSSKLRAGFMGIVTLHGVGTCWVCVSFDLCTYFALHTSNIKKRPGVEKPMQHPGSGLTTKQPANMHF